MSRSAGEGERRSFSTVTLIAGVLVVGGALLAATVDMAFLVVLGLGAFGPGALREVGVLDDQDEFQRETARAGGYRAYLAAGLFATAWLALMRRGTASLDSEPALAVAAVLFLLMVVWLLSSLLSYWGARRATSRALLVFGSFWLVFVVLSHVTEPLTLLIESAVAAPFFVLAWTARRWPRATGALLVLLGGYGFFAVDPYGALTEHTAAWLVLLTLFLPLLVCGVALLVAGPETGNGEDVEADVGLDADAPSPPGA